MGFIKQQLYSQKHSLKAAGAKNVSAFILFKKVQSTNCVTVDGNDLDLYRSSPTCVGLTKARHYGWKILNNDNKA